MLRKRCIPRLILIIPHQQQNPSKIGLPPILISFTMFVFSPTALIARTIKNLLSVLMGEKTLASTPKWTATVVRRLAAIK